MENGYDEEKYVLNSVKQQHVQLSSMIGVGMIAVLPCDQVLQSINLTIPGMVALL